MSQSYSATLSSSESGSDGESSTLAARSSSLCDVSLIVVGVLAVLVGTVGLILSGLGGGGSGGTAASRPDLLAEGAPGQCRKSTCATGELFPRGEQVGVNFGGWLVLEDWFFSKAEDNDRTELVASRKTHGEGFVFPSSCGDASLTFDGGSGWRSEGELTSNLLQAYQENQAADPLVLFARHRATYITKRDYEQLATLGVTKIRLPIPWQAFADALCDNASNVLSKYCNDDPVNRPVVVPDPYYIDKISLVTVPRAILSSFVSDAHDKGLKVIFDIHTMPGGSSDGTYSSTWPNPPAFWQQNVTDGVALQSLGLKVVEALVGWVASLGALREAVAGFTFMNEPAMQAHGGAALGGASWLDDHNDVLDWLAAAGRIFESARQKLSPHTRVYVNLHESAFRHGLFHWPWESPVDPEVSWFMRQYADSPWAVLDIHHYHAWKASPPECDGISLQAILDDHVKWVDSTFSVLDLKGRLAMSEYSASTFHEVALACRETRFLRAFVYGQAAACTASGVEPFFWTWRMPEGGIFQRGWSLKLIAGFENESKGRSCGRAGAESVA